MISNLRRFSLTALGIAALALGAAAAQEDAAPEEQGRLEVTRAAIAKAVEDREPVEEGTSFASDVGQLVCFTRVEGAGEGRMIHHVWSHGGEEKARVELPLNGSPWRTWSSKRILPSWSGDWTVTVEDEDGTVLTRLDFVIEEAGEAEPR